MICHTGETSTFIKCSSGCGWLSLTSEARDATQSDALQGQPYYSHLGKETDVLSKFGKIRVCVCVCISNMVFTLYIEAFRVCLVIDTNGVIVLLRAVY